MDSLPADLDPRPDESLDRLVGDWHILQLRRGHRFSTDDLVCAWRGTLAAPGARRYLDIGCGIGSVAMSALYRLPADATVIGVEAQEVSVALARRSVARNGLAGRARILHGDLRDPEVLDAGLRFELITGSPPYIPLGTGVVSPVPQRAGARMELRGSVYDYCEAAKRWLAPGGRFCFVMAAADARTEDAPLKAGLQVVERFDYVFARGRDPLVCTLICAHAEEELGPRAEGRLVIRGPDGEWTDEYLAFREEMSSFVSSQRSAVSNQRDEGRSSS